MDSPNFDHFVIEPEMVADAVVKQLHSGSWGHSVLPAHYTLACALRRLNLWVPEPARNGINQGKFVLRSFGTIVLLPRGLCSVGGLTIKTPQSLLFLEHKGSSESQEWIRVAI